MVNHPPEEFYKNIAHKYHWLLSSWEKVMERQMEELVPLLMKYNVKSVLDCACGTGLQAIGLKKAGFDVVGSDLSKEMLAVAKANLEKEKIKDLQLIEADFREVSKKVGRKFDAVICMGNSLPHLFGDKEILKALRSIYDCLKDDGVAIIEIRNYDKMLQEKNRFLPLRIHEEKDDKVISILYVFDYLEDRIRFNVVYLIEEKSTGEKRIEVEAVDYNPIRSYVFMELLNEAGFVDIQKAECGPNVQYTAAKESFEKRK